VAEAPACGLASHIPQSQWFLIVAFGSLFVVAAKQYSGLVSHPTRDPQIAGLLHPGLPAVVWSISAGVTITAYCLGAFQVDVGCTPMEWGRCVGGPVRAGIAALPVGVDRGRAGEPEQIAGVKSLCIAPQSGPCRSPPRFVDLREQEVVVSPPFLRRRIEVDIEVTASSRVLRSRHTQAPRTRRR